eukprot:CAMPEP_0119276682 /NCGR_PEP_ID=MMETSP1329-20130426/15766_1 /TAXON_ID=114041 /ORGANISM="Genus nov. species nov., Strain RCC1024" /LENGTH=866 /DNA_ID=CAMNT_0007277119 /DNA_START=167 /DNA_END=2767 /DNA_ORIENTATION=+
MNAWRQRAGGLLEPQRSSFKPYDSQISVKTVDKKRACFPAQQSRTWDTPLGGNEKVNDKKMPNIASKIQEDDVNTNLDNSTESEIHVALTADTRDSPKLSGASTENIQMRAVPHAKLDIVDADLHSTLLQIVDGDPSMSLEYGIDRLDAMIKRTTVHVNELLFEPISKYLAASSDWHDPSPEILWPIHTISSKIHAAAMPRFACLFEENHLITKQASFHHEPPISVAMLRPRNMFEPRRESSSNLTFPLYQQPQETPFWLINKAHHTTLVPVLHADVRRRMRELCSYLADQAQDYHSAEMKWRANLRTWQDNNGRSINHEAGNLIDSHRFVDIEHEIEDNDSTSRASLFSLNSSRASGFASFTIDRSGGPGGPGAPTRARKTLNTETSDHEHLMSTVLASSAKETRFEHGSIDDDDLPLPLPVSVLTSDDTRIDESTISCRFVSDPLMHETHFSLSRQWTDLEKCIFLDKFLQYPKNFGKIAAFFSRKRARDCSQLYYDSKYDIDYKALLREHQQRRRGVRTCWEITAKAVQVFGGEIDHDPQRNMVWFRLPNDNFSIRNARRLHPPNNRTMRVFSSEPSSSSLKSAGCLAPLKQANHFQSSVPSTAYTDAINTRHPINPVKGSLLLSNNISSSTANTTSMTRSRSRSRQILPRLTLGGVEGQHAAQDIESDDAAYISAQTREVYCSMVANNVEHEIKDTTKPKATASIHHRQAKTWSSAEKAVFLRLVTPRGKNWAMLACHIPTKSEAQIQTYLLNYKSRLGLETWVPQSISHPGCSGCPRQRFNLAFPAQSSSEDPFPGRLSSQEYSSVPPCVLNAQLSQDACPPFPNQAQDDKYFSLNGNKSVIRQIFNPRLHPDWWPNNTTC